MRVVADGPHEDATALGVRDGRIVAVGSDAEVRALCGPRTRVVSAPGCCVTPGLVDAHQHPFWGARATRGADLTPAGSLDEARRLLADEARRAGPGRWVLGHGLRREWFGGGAVSGRLLDDAVSGAPLFATFTDGHSALATPEALRRAGVTGPRAFPDASAIVCVDGLPTGELLEPSAMDVVRAAIPAITTAHRRELYVATLARMAARGLTALHVMDSDPNILDDLAALEADGDLSVRLVMAMWRKPTMTLTEMREALPDQVRHGRRWRTGAAKFFLDGVVGGGTAWLDEPDRHGRRGGPFWEDTGHYAAAVRMHAAAGVACVTHAIGDAAARFVLDTYASAPPASAPAGAHAVRHRLEHAELVRPADVPRLGALGVVASMQPIHLTSAAELADTLGDAGPRPAWPWASIAAGGATLAFGSDWPVADADPLLGMAWARLRRSPGRPRDAVHDPDQRVDARATLAAYTRGGAYAVGEESVAGVIAPGMRADLTVLSGDPTLTDADDLPALRVHATVVDGRIVHDDLP